MKICYDCHIKKDDSEFYKNHQNKDGLSSYCKECTDKRTNARRLKFKKPPKPKKVKQLTYNQRLRLAGYEFPTNPDSYYNLFPEKSKASRAAQVIPIENGQERHHWSYLDEHHLDVIILPKIDHMAVHRKIKYDQERMMFRGLDGVLLDTRQSHEEYINNILLEYHSKK